MDVIIAALATWQIVEIWHHSLLLAPLRARAELLTNKLGELLTCPFCLSNWVAGFCVVAMSIQGCGMAGLLLRWGIIAFAAARLANLGNDVFYKYNRTPKGVAFE